jgi:hypothetical protein
MVQFQVGTGARMIYTGNGGQLSGSEWHSVQLMEILLIPGLIICQVIVGLLDVVVILRLVTFLSLIELISFTASLSGRVVVNIDWATASRDSTTTFSPSSGRKME